MFQNKIAIYKVTKQDVKINTSLGDLFAMFYTQAMSFRKSADMQEEIMAFLKSFTSEDFDMR